MTCFAGVIAQVTAPQCVGHLLRVAAVRFADLHAHRLRPFAAPYAGDVRHARLFEVMPSHRRKRRRRPGRALVGAARARARKTAVKDWIASMGDRFHTDRVFGRLAAAVVAGILAERSFQSVGARVGRDEAFEHDLSARRHQQVAQFALDQFHRRAAERAGHFIFRIIHRRGGGEKQRLVPADDDRHRHLLRRGFCIC